MSKLPMSLALAAVAATLALPAHASSHREAPMVRGQQDSKPANATSSKPTTSAATSGKGQAARPAAPVKK